MAYFDGDPRNGLSRDWLRDHDPELLRLLQRKSTARADLRSPQTAPVLHSRAVRRA